MASLLPGTHMHISNVGTPDTIFILYQWFSNHWRKGKDIVPIAHIFQKIAKVALHIQSWPLKFMFTQNVFFYFWIKKGNIRIQVNFVLFIVSLLGRYTLFVCPCDHHQKVMESQNLTVIRKKGGKGNSSNKDKFFGDICLRGELLTVASPGQEAKRFLPTEHRQKK